MYQYILKYILWWLPCAISFYRCDIIFSPRNNDKTMRNTEINEAREIFRPSIYRFLAPQFIVTVFLRLFVISGWRRKDAISRLFVLSLRSLKDATAPFLYFVFSPRNNEKTKTIVISWRQDNKLRGLKTKNSRAKYFALLITTRPHFHIIFTIGHIYVFRMYDYKLRLVFRSDVSYKCIRFGWLIFEKWTIFSQNRRESFPDTLNLWLSTCIGHRCAHIENWSQSLGSFSGFGIYVM